MIRYLLYGIQFVLFIVLAFETGRSVGFSESALIFEVLLHD